QHDPNDPKSLSNDIVLSICEDSSGILWIGTRGGGLDKFDQEWWLDIDADIRQNLEIDIEIA
ncbi:hypothetical protein IH970_13300, partial [candidate division KSB1 bacterium]|nr:hypothetical protein [candidate division KSB1 bacterium]